MMGQSKMRRTRKKTESKDDRLKTPADYEHINDAIEAMNKAYNQVIEFERKEVARRFVYLIQDYRDTEENKAAKRSLQHLLRAAQRISKERP